MRGGGMKKLPAFSTRWWSALIIVIPFLSQPAISQTNFQKYSANPVLTTGPAGSWDGDKIFSGSVLYLNQQYRMWYCGMNGGVVSVGYAFSVDGLTWTKYSGNPVLLPGAANEYDAALGGCYVLFYSGMFHMWYNGGNAGDVRVGYASSVDGISWRKHPAFVFDTDSGRGAGGIFGGVGPAVKEDTLLKMFYWSRTAGTWWMTGLATSRDSVCWKSENSGYPVLTGGLTGEWDHYSRAAGTVLKTDSVYEMWYDNEKQAPYSIGYARSTTGGATWTTYGGNPIVRGDEGAWDASFTVLPMVVRNPDSSYYLYYTGGKTRDAITGIGLAIETPPPSDVHMQRRLEKSPYAVLRNSDTPASAALLRNFPNPFNPVTTIRYALPTRTHVRLVIYNMLGQAVAEAVHEDEEAGWKEVQWNAAMVASGVYYYRLQAGNFVETKKMTVVK